MHRLRDGDETLHRDQTQDVFHNAAVELWLIGTGTVAVVYSPSSMYPRRSIGIWAMSDVTRILSQIEDGDGQAAEQLLPLAYDELRKLAAAKMAQEKPGQTLQATALVHEAYLRVEHTDHRIADHNR